MKCILENQHYNSRKNNNNASNTYHIKRTWCSFVIQSYESVKLNSIIIYIINCCFCRSILLQHKTNLGKRKTVMWLLFFSSKNKKLDGDHTQQHTKNVHTVHDRISSWPKQQRQYSHLELLSKELSWMSLSALPRLSRIPYLQFSILLS